MIQKTREQLLQRRKELEERLEQIRNDLGRGLEADLEEQAIQLENRDTMLEIARIAQEELDEVDARLRQFEE